MSIIKKINRNNVTMAILIVIIVYMLTRDKKEGFVGTIKYSNSSETEQKDITFNCVDTKPTDQRLTCTYTGGITQFTIPRPLMVETIIALDKIIYVDNIKTSPNTLDINIDFTQLPGNINIGSIQFKLIGITGATNFFELDKTDERYKLGKLLTTTGSGYINYKKDSIIFVKAFVPAFNMLNENKIIAKIKVEYSDIKDQVKLDPTFKSFIAEPNNKGKGITKYISRYGKD